MSMAMRNLLIPPLAGWYSSDGTTRDNIYLNAAGSAAVSTGGTDTAILHDGS